MQNQSRYKKVSVSHRLRADSLREKGCPVPIPYRQVQWPALIGQHGTGAGRPSFEHIGPPTRRKTYAMLGDLSLDPYAVWSLLSWFESIVSLRARR